MGLRAAEKLNQGQLEFFVIDPPRKTLPEPPT